MNSISRIPITHSILCADALASVIARAYDLGGTVHCELMARGVNDVYLIRAAGTRYAARVLRHNLRTRNQVRYEMALIRFHVARDVRASTPLLSRNGESFIPVQALEGERYLSVFTWADGEPMAYRATPRDAHRLGAVVANMHRAVSSFEPPVAIEIDTPSLMAERLPALLAMVGADSEDGRLYADLVARTSERLRMLELPRGACHGDVHTHNVFLARDGRLTFIDWDNCGSDFFAKELLHFVWRNDYLNKGHDLSRAFLTGYESTRPLSAEERKQLPLFLVVRHLFILCGMAGMINIVGRSAVGYEHHLTRFQELIRKPAQEAGLL